MLHNIDHLYHFQPRMLPEYCFHFQAIIKNDNIAYTPKCPILSCSKSFESGNSFPGMQLKKIITKDHRTVNPTQCLDFSCQKRLDKYCNYA